MIYCKTVYFACLAKWLSPRTRSHQSASTHSDFGTNRDGTTVLDQHALSCRINRLKRHLPSDLRKVIEQNSLTQILKIPAHEIYLAEVFYDEVYEVGTDANYREVREALHLAGL